MKRLIVEFNGPMVEVMGEDGRRTGPLSIGEALDVIACRHYTGKVKQAMQTEAEWAQQLEEIAKHIGADFSFNEGGAS